jgi:hypothetical protein
MTAARSSSIRELIRRRWLYAATLLAIPFAYWEVSQRLLKPSGLFAGFNTIAVHPSTIARSFKQFAVNGVIQQLHQSLAALARPWPWPLAAALVLVVALAWTRLPRDRFGARRQALLGVCLGLVIAGLAVLPYAVVGDYPSIHGWDTRHDLLLGPPVAALLVMGSRLVAPSGRAAHVAMALLAVLAAGFSAAGIQDYAALQARWATDRAVTNQLAANVSAGDFSVYRVRDGAPGPEDFYRFYEWSAMLGLVYGDQSRIGLDSRAYDVGFLDKQQFFTDRYDLAHLDPQGCEAALTILRGSSAPDPAHVAFSYTWTRLFSPGSLSTYLETLATVQVTAQPAAQATRCVR